MKLIVIIWNIGYATRVKCSPVAASRIILVGAGIFCLAGLPGCTSPPPAPPGDPELRQEILQHFGTEILLPDLQQFEAQADDLLGACKTAAATPGDVPEDARLAFAVAMRTWQRVELMQIGPLATMERGGEDLRDEIYSWPVRNTCRVDQALAKGEYQNSDTLLAQTVNARGLDAMEYLLFTEGSDNTCASTIDINEDGLWAKLTDEEIRTRRLDYAQALAELVYEKAKEATAAYDPAKGGFVTELITAGSESSIYPTTQDAFNDWAETLFYLDVQTKDMKLGEPAGIQECAISSCPVELPASGFSSAAIAENLVSFDLQFFGGVRPDDGPGFDDLLINVKQKALALEMADLLNQAHAAAAAVQDPLEKSITDDPEAVQALYDSIRAVRNLYEIEVFSVLSLELPDTGASDSD